MNTDFLSAIDAKQDEIIKLADTIWENPEIAFKEYKSSAAIISYLKENDFEIEDNIGGIPTAFIASYGSGHPEIGFIAEFDAISDLSQAAQVAVQQKDPNCVHGHACGHHLYGAGAVAAALAVQNYLRKTGKKGTVKVLGCPGEEGGSGKAFMAAAKHLWQEPEFFVLLTPQWADILNVCGRFAPVLRLHAAIFFTALTAELHMREQIRIWDAVRLMQLN